MIAKLFLQKKVVVLTLFKLGLAIFSIELAIMFFLAALFPGLHQGMETFIDALMVTVFSALICQKWLPLLASRELQEEGDADSGITDKIFAWLSQISKFAIVVFSVEGAIMLLLPEDHDVLGNIADALILALVAPPSIYVAFSSLRNVTQRRELSPKMVFRPFLLLFVPSVSAMLLLGSFAYLAEIRTGEVVIQKELENHLELVKTQITQRLQSVLFDLLLLSHQDALFAPAPANPAPVQEAIIQQLSHFLTIKYYYQEIWLLDQNHRPMVKARNQPDKVDFAFIPTGEDGAITSNLTSVQTIIHPLGKSLDDSSVEAGKFPAILMGTPAYDGGGVKHGYVLIAFSAEKLLQELDSIAKETGGHLTILDNHGKLWHQSPPSGEEKVSTDDFSLSFHLNTLSLSVGKIIDRTSMEIKLTRQPMDVAMPAWALTITIPRSYLSTSLKPFLTTLFSLGLTLFPLLALGIWTLTVIRYHHRQAEQALVEHANELERIVGERTRQLVHADRLATLGTFSAGMAHEINNPNAFIASNIDFLKLYWKLARPILERHKEEDGSGRVFRFADEIDSVLSGILDGSHRITKIVSSLKTYSKGGMNADMVVCRLMEPIQDAQNLLQFKLKRDVTVILDVPLNHVLVCDRQQMAQVFVNLMQNSLDAMEANTSTREIRIRSAQNGEHYWIRCEDTGPGIPKETIEKIFDPFYTTKGKTKGTGLGLSIVHGIISDHFGQISAFNHAEGGAEFLIILPVKELFETHFASRMAKEKSRGIAYQ